MVGYQLRAAALLAILATTQCSAADETPDASLSKPAPATHSAYFTEMMVQSDSLEPAKCSDRVLEARRTATITQGVEPTVSLQAALLIFLGVGIFAVFIAQAFQMVSSEIIKLAKMLMHSWDDLRYSFPFPLLKDLAPSPPTLALDEQFHTQVRKYVYRDADNLDTAFDAGGKVSIGLTATTIVSQWTWSATLLQSSTVASKVKKINDAFWKFEKELFGMLHYVIGSGGQRP